MSDRRVREAMATDWRWEEALTKIRASARAADLPTLGDRALVDMVEGRWRNMMRAEAIGDAATLSAEATRLAVAAIELVARRVEESTD